MKKAIQIYSEAYQKHGCSLASLLIPKGRQNQRFGALTTPMRGDGFSVLDYGCGFGDLRPFLQSRFPNVRYTGVDIMKEFIKDCRDLHGAEADFRLIDDYREIQDDFDYVVVSGVFNTLYSENGEEHWSVVQDIMRFLYARTRRAISFDFMTDQVDYTVEDAFHLSPLKAYGFAERNLSKRLSLDHSYMPYEFALIVYKDDAILRPENVYTPL